MSNHTFTPGQRVRAFPGGRIGIVVDVDAETAANYPGFTHLQYDGDEGVSLCDTQKLMPLDRAIELESFTDDALKAELALRTIQPPAGFRTETFMECGRDGYDPCEPYGECGHEKDITYMGPGHYEAKGWRISTQWTPRRGIFYILDHDEPGIWTPEEIEELPEALKKVSYKIDLDAALEYMSNHPELTKEKITINRLCEAAQREGLNWGAMAEAWTILRDGKAGK